MNKLSAGIIFLVIAFAMNYFFFAQETESVDVSAINHSKNDSQVAIMPSSIVTALPLKGVISIVQTGMYVTAEKNIPVQAKQINGIAHDKDKHHQEQSSGTKKQFTLDEVLLNIPQDYHSIFSWNTGQDDNFIEEYGQLQESQQLEEFQQEVENQISSFIFQHQQGNYIQIERLNCTRNSCEILGLTQMSNAWSDIEHDMSKTPWWPFSSSTAHNGVSENGQMVFLVLFYK